MRVTTARAFDPENTEPVSNRMPFYEIDGIAMVVGMDMAIALPVAMRTPFFVQDEGIHTRIKKRFC